MMQNEEADMKAYESFGGLLQMMPIEPPPTAPAGQAMPPSSPAGVGGSSLPVASQEFSSSTSTGAADFPDAFADTNVQLLEAILQELRSLNQNLRNSL